MSVLRERCCTTAMPIPCRRRRSACRPRCTCMRNECALWRRGMKPIHPRKFVAQEGSSLAGASCRDGGGGLGETRQALSETAAVVGTGRAGDSLSHRDRASPTTAVVRGCRSAAPDSAEPWSGSSAAGHGRRPEAADLWCVLCREISATRVELSAGGAMKTDKTGDARGRPSWRSSFLGDPGAIFSGGKRDSTEEDPAPRKLGEVFLFLLFLPGGATCSGPQQSRARRCSGAAERTLDGEDRCESIGGGGKGRARGCKTV